MFTNTAFDVQPPNSTDFSSLDFYPWGHSKILVYLDPVKNEMNSQGISHACQTILNHPGNSEIVWSPCSGMSMHAVILVQDILNHFYNKNSKVIKSGTRIMSVVSKILHS